MNNVILMGRLTRAPEVRHLNDKKHIRFTLAVDRGLSKEKKREAEEKNQQTADFINCEAWGKTAELIERYFDKGDPILLEGRIRTGKYEKDGQMIYTTDVLVNKIHFLPKTASNKTDSFNNVDDTGFFPIDNEDIPF